MGEVNTNTLCIKIRKTGECSANQQSGLSALVRFDLFPGILNREDGQLKCLKAEEI